MKKLSLILIALFLLLLFSCATTKGEEIVMEAPTFEEAKEEIVPPSEEQALPVEEEGETTLIEERDEEENLTVIEKADGDEMIIAFNYAYGIKTTEDLTLNGVSLISSYFVLGLYDAFYKPNSPSFIGLVDIENIINEFIIQYLNNGISFDYGARPVYLEDILALDFPVDLPSSFSYAYGFSIMRTLVSEDVDIEIMTFMTGVLDSLYSEVRPLSDTEIQNAVNSYVIYLNEEYYKTLENMAEDNRVNAEEFFEENILTDGIKVLDNGVQILVLDEDETIGASPTEYDTVIMDYNEYIVDYNTGDLVFTDADYNVEVSLFNLSSGLRSAIAATRTGQAVRAFIPPELSRLPEGDGDEIPPYSIFVYDIALHEIL